MRLWKKVLSAVTAGALFVGGVGLPGVQNVLESVGTVLSASAKVPLYYDDTYGDLYYSITDNGEIEITGCNEDAVIVEIPSEIDGKPVTRIGECAFSEDCAGLTAIDIPDSVTSIGEGAFENCKKLVKVTIPNSVTSIGPAAFCNCENLTEITIPDSAAYIGEYAFLGTPWFAAKREENPLVIVSGIVIDGTTCTGSVVIPDGVTGIGGFAFADCESITEVTIPDGVTNIRQYAFSGCENLTKITISDSLTSVEIGAFSGCTNLTIYGYTGSYVETYAKKKDIPFVSLGNATILDPTLAKGDLDGSDRIDSTDIFYTMYYVANVAVGNPGGLTTEQIAAADVDGSGKVDSTDVFYMMYYVALHGVGKDVSWEEVLAK